MVTRINLIQSHLLSNLRFDPDPSLNEYRLRGDQFPIPLFRDFYYEVGLEHYKFFYPVIRSAKSLTHENDFVLSKSEMRRKIIQQTTELNSKIRFNRQSHKTNSLAEFICGRILFSYDLGLCTRIGVSAHLFIDALLSLGTEKHFTIVDSVYRFNDYGCFAMTELGHGSNVASIGTTATYIQETREFEINTPNSLSAKWWIGAAGQTATKAAVFAQLIVNGKEKGVHAFVLSLRDASLNVNKGILIGDCGHKNELNGIDNGFIVFQKYRVPYDALLDKISQITTEGEFRSVISKKEKRFGRMLSSLIRGRGSVPQASESNLRHALTAAVRWAAIRKQFGSTEKEVPILNYGLTRSRLMPSLSNLFAMNVSIELHFLRFDKIKELMEQDPECVEVVEHHAILSAFKVLSSEWSFSGIHEARKICGGIGYSGHNRIGELLSKQDVLLTWEGDNNILLQQTSGFVIKHVQKMMQGKASIVRTLAMIELDVEKLKSFKFSEHYLDLKELLLTLHVLLNVLLHKSLGKLQDSAGKFESFFDTWNANQFFIQDLGRVFGVIVMTDLLVQRVSTAAEPIRPILTKVVQLFALDKILKYSSELLAFGYLHREGYQKYEDALNNLTWAVGESAVRIIDSIADEDFMHGIPIGCSDGQAYQRLCSQIESQEDCYSKATWTGLVREMLNHHKTDPYSSIT